MLNGGKLKALSWNKMKMLAISTCFQCSIRNSSQNSQASKKQQIEKPKKKKKKVLLLIDYLIQYVGIPKYTTDKLLELVREYSKWLNKSQHTKMKCIPIHQKQIEH